MKTIDVSHWNNLEDLWKYDFEYEQIIAKISEGATLADYTAYTYYLYANAFKKLFSVYHFAHPQNNTAESEFKNFEKHYKKLNDTTVGIVLDIEGAALNYKDLDNWCYEWLSRATKLTNNKVMIYMSQSSCKLFNKCKVYPLWVARYKDISKGYGDVSPWEKADLWQYDSKGIDKSI